MSKNVLILLEHPNFKYSVANKALYEAVKDIEGTNIVFVEDVAMDVDFYKQAVEKADVIVFQFPFRWGAAPHKLKQWIDEVFSTFSAEAFIKEKTLLVATTTGSEQAAYRGGGRNRYTVDELFRPYQFLAEYCKMKWLTPFSIHGCAKPGAAERINAGTIEFRSIIEELLR